MFGLPAWLIYVWDALQAAPTLFNIFNSIRTDVNNGTVPVSALPQPVTNIDGTISPIPITTNSVLTQYHQNYKNSPKAPAPQ